MLGIMGQWVSIFNEAIYVTRPSGITVENKACDFILQNGDTYYLFCCDLPMEADVNVALVQGANYTDVFVFEKKITEITWLDNGAALPFEQKDGQVVVHTEPFSYGRNLVVRVAKITTAG